MTVTDCSFQADWQTLLLFHSATTGQQQHGKAGAGAAGAAGAAALTRVAVNCSHKARFELLNQYQRFWPHYFLHFYTHDYGNGGGLDVEQAATADFVSSILLSSTASSNPVTAISVVVLDCASIFLRPVSGGEEQGEDPLLLFASNHRLPDAEAAVVKLNKQQAQLTVTAATAARESVSIVRVDPDRVLSDVGNSKEHEHEHWGVVDSLGSSVCDLPHADAAITHSHAEAAASAASSKLQPVLLHYGAYPGGRAYSIDEYHFSSHAFMSGGGMPLMGCWGVIIPPSTPTRGVMRTPSSSSSSDVEGVPASFLKEVPPDIMHRPSHEHSHYPEDSARLRSARNAFAVCHLYAAVNAWLSHFRARVCPAADISEFARSTDAAAAAAHTTLLAE